MTSLASLVLICPFVLDIWSHDSCCLTSLIFFLSVFVIPYSSLYGRQFNVDLDFTVMVLDTTMSIHFMFTFLHNQVSEFSKNVISSELSSTSFIYVCSYFILFFSLILSPISIPLFESFHYGGYNNLS